MLCSNNYLGKDYSKEEEELNHKYSEIEMNCGLSDSFRRKSMIKWRNMVFDLLIKHGLSKKSLNELSHTKQIHLRHAAAELFRYLNTKKIPLIIISASGVGEVIPQFLQNMGLKFPNQIFFTNHFVWDSAGKAVNIKRPIIHTMNKNALKIDLSISEGILNGRKNIVLLGDTIDDLEMAKNFTYNNIHTFCFLNKTTQKHLDIYKKAYDRVILDDGGMDDVLELVKKIILD